MLSTEALTAIVDKIDHQGTLFDLLLCSRLLYRIALPFLYRHVGLVRRVNLKTRQVLYPNAYDFACRVLRDPQLAIFVESITIVPSYSTEDLPSYGAETESLDSGILRAVAYDWEGGDKHLKAFRKCRDSETAIAILLPFLPQLRELHLVTGDELEAFPKSACIRMMRRMTHTTIFGNPSDAFQHLRHVSLSSRRDVIRQEELMTLYGVSKLQKISASPLIPTYWQEQQERAKQRFARIGTSNVKDVSLTGIRLSPQGIVTYLEPCRTIKAIELVWQANPLFQTAHSKAGWIMMNDALLSAIETLESLTMTYSAAISLIGGQEVKRFLPLEALPQLHELKFLKLGMAFLFYRSDILVAEHAPWDPSSEEAQTISQTLAAALPRQIEELHFVCHEIEHLIVLFMNIRNLLTAVAQGSFTSLRSIKIENIRLDLTSPSQRTQEWDLQDIRHLDSEPETRDLLIELQRRSEELHIAFQWSVRLAVPKML